MQFERRQFAGMPLDILVGHPEHELLFVATQVARAPGLKDPSTSIQNVKKVSAAGHMYLSSLLDNLSGSLPKEPNGYSLRVNTVLFTESVVYEMLLRGHAPQSEPFRKWVTEEVLPSLRKSGTYTMPGAPQPALPALPAALNALGSLIQESGANGLIVPLDQNGKPPPQYLREVRYSLGR